MRNIIVLWPTVRAEMFCKTLKEWERLSAHPETISYRTRVRTQEQAVEILKLKLYSHVHVSEGNESLPKAMCGLALDLVANDEDIVLCAQDDQFPPIWWDSVLRNAFEGWEGAVFFNDGIQKPPSEACVMPCLTFGALKKLNRIIYHPDYRHLYCDNEFVRNCTELGLMKDVRTTNPAVFEHRHYSTGKRPVDDIDLRIDREMPEDQATFERRMKLPLAERLK